MYVLLSPAKRLVEPPAADLPATTPALLPQTEQLLKVAKKLSSKQLQKLMDISEALGDLNHARFQQATTEPTREQARQAALSFAGDAYLGLRADTLSEADLAWAQDHVGILSGLYGVLRPLDLIVPYRLEMGTALKTRRGKDLYAFWGDRITDELRARVAGHDDPTIVNLASTEYFSAVKPKRLATRVVTPVFQEVQDGKARTLSFFAKKARGMAARWVIVNRVDHVDALKAFDDGGYRFEPAESTADRWVFRRPQPGPPGSED